jgi:hypothetical protein
VSNILDLAELIYNSMIDFENKNLNSVRTQLMEPDLFVIANTDSVLDRALYTLNLLPANGLGIILYVTDGVSSDFSSLDLHDTQRIFLRNYIQFGVVQVGSGLGFTPTCNLGFVPNQEDLRYIVEALDGVFSYAEACPYIDDEQEISDTWNQYQQLLMHKSMQFVDPLDEEIVDHKSRVVDVVRSRFINTGFETSAIASSNELEFPWKYDSQAPSVAQILCSYRNYKVPRMELEKLIRTRINEGFILSKLKYSRSLKNALKVEFTFSFVFAQHIEILYTLKCTCDPTIPLSSSTPSKAIRVELNVLAHHSFAVLFINVHSFDHAKQSAIGNGLYQKLGQLHEILKAITETDETLQILLQSNSPAAVMLAKQINGEPIAKNQTVDLPSNYWQYLNQVLLIKQNLLDSWSRNVMLRSTSSQVNLGQRAVQNYFGTQDSTNRTRYQVATIYLSKFLNSWASFALSKTNYVRWVYASEESTPVGFCLLQIAWETESLMNVTLRFHGCSLEDETELIEEFQQGIYSIRHTLRNSSSMIEPLLICSKPANSLMVGYSAVNNEEVPDDFRDLDDPANSLFVGNGSFARQLLQHHSWVWFADITTNPEDVVSKLIESSFVALYNSRNHEGYLRISESAGAITFYKEVEYDSTIAFVVQYVLLWNPKKDFLMTEVWVEPLRGGKNPKDLDYFALISQELYEKDLFLMNRLLAIELLVNAQSLVQRSPMTVSNPLVTFVETRFHLLGLLEQSSMVYSPFKCLNYDQENHIALMESKDDSITFKPILVPLESEYGMRVDMLRLFMEENEQVCPNCQLKEEELSDDELKNANKILYGFFLASIGLYCDRWFFWKPKKDSESILDQIQGAINPEVIQLPRLCQAHVFMKVFGSKVYFFVIGNVESNDLLTTLIIESDTKGGADGLQVRKRQSLYVINVSGAIFSNDGSSWIEVMPLSQSQKAETSSLENIRYVFAAQDGSDDVEHHDHERMELQLRISQLFYDALCKSLFYSFAQKLTISNSDFDRCVVRLKTKDISIDLSDFLLLYSLHNEESALQFQFKLQTGFQKIVTKSFEKVSKYLQDPDPSNYYFLKPRQNNSAELIAQSDFPLFMTSFLAEGSTFQVCTDGLPAAVFKNIPIHDRPFPSPSKVDKVLLLFRLHGLCDEQDQIRLGQEWSERLSEFQDSFENLVHDLVLESILLIPEIQINEAVVQYVDSIFLSRNQKYEPMDVTELSRLEDGSHSFRVQFTLDFLDESCCDFFCEDLTSYEVAGEQFRVYNKGYYVFNEGNSVSSEIFWVMVRVKESKLLLDIYCGSERVEGRLDLLQLCFGAFESCCHRANQRFLLKELSETHSARDEPPTCTFQKISPNVVKDDVLYDYGCPIQFTKFFPVHWRLRPMQVSNSVTSALQAITVTNRRGLLVYSEKYYIRIETRDDEDEKATQSTDSTTERHEKGIVITAYGLDEVQDDIAVDFVRMISSRIDSMVQNVLGTFLVRNPTARLTRADLEFVMPVGPNKSPSSHTTYLLVPELENPHLYIVLLRQAFMLFLKPLFGSDLYGLLGEFYQQYYGQNISVVREKHPHNELQIGDLSFYYNSVPSRYTTLLESSIGFGLASICLTPMDRSNTILFPSVASSTLWNNHNVVLDEHCYKVKATQDLEEVLQWSGFKIAVSLWCKGGINLEPLLERIDSAFQHTLVDYTIESYYRSSKWHSLSSKKKLPDLPSHTEQFEPGNHQPEFLNVLQTLPAILETGSERKNPVVQSIRINNKLPLDSIVTGIRSIFSDEEIQAYFFSNSSDGLCLMDTLPDPKQGYSRDYIVIGASDIYVPPKTTDRRMSAISDTSSAGSLSPRLGSVRLTRNTSLESVSEGSDFDRERKDSGKLGLNFDFEEIFMFPDIFYPSFPVYGKRSSFFMICLYENHVSVSTYK